MGEVNTEPKLWASSTGLNLHPISLPYHLAWLRHLALRCRGMIMSYGP